MAASRLSISMKASAAPVDRRKLERGGIGAEQRAGFAEVAMGVHVDGFDPLAARHDG